MPLDFYKAPPDYERLANAIYRVEGSEKAKVPYGILSVPVKDAQEARKVAINTAKNNYERWTQAGQPGSYIDFLADKYVPPSVDKTGNTNWKVNVAKIYQESEPKSPVMVQGQSIFTEPLPPVTLPRYPFIP